MKGKGLSPTVTRAVSNEKSLIRTGTVIRAGKSSADIELAGGDVIYDVPVSGAVKAQQRVQVLTENGSNIILGAAKESGTSSTVVSATGVFQGAPVQHALNGPNHTGTLAQSQAPWALAADGSVTLVGNLTVQAGVTVDGVDISAFKAAYDAHNHDTRYLQLTGGALSGPLSSNPFTSGVEGWQIDQSGITEMDSLTLRSSLHAQSFVTDLVSAHVGDDIHAKSAGTLHVEMVVPTSGTWTMMIDDAPGTSALLFDSGDIIQAKLAIGGVAKETWFTVGAGTSNGDGTQSYTCTRQSGDVSVTYGAGAGVVDWGVANQGLLISSTRGLYGPYFDVRTHAGAPWTTQTTRLRIGNLRGWDGIASNRYGIGIGDYAGGSYLKYEPGIGLVVKGGGGHVSIEPNGIAVAMSSSTSDFTAAYVFGSLSAPSGYLRYYTDDIASGYPKWLDIHHQSITSGGIRMIADGTSGYSGRQTSAVLHTNAFEVGDSYASVAGVYAWTNRFIHIASDGMVVDVGLNLGTATGAIAGQVIAKGMASGSDIFVATPNVGGGADEGYLAVNSRARFGYEANTVIIDDHGTNKAIVLRTGGVNRITISSGGVVLVGKTSSTLSTTAGQIETVGDIASIATSNSLTKQAGLHIHRNDAAASVQVDNEYTALGTSSGAVFMGNTGTIPTAADQRLAVFGGGYIATGGSNRRTAAMSIWSSQKMTDGSAYGSHIRWETTPSGSSTRQERMRLTDAGWLGVGVTAPGGPLDVRNSAGGFTVYVGQVSSSTVTVISSGCHYATIAGAIRDSNGGQTYVSSMDNTTADDAYTTSSGNTINIRLSGGVLDIRRTAGSLTFNVSLEIRWV